MWLDILDYIGLRKKPTIPFDDLIKKTLSCPIRAAKLAENVRANNALLVRMYSKDDFYDWVLKGKDLNSYYKWHRDIVGGKFDPT